MSLHRSLKTQPAALNQHRNVLTRAERIARLREQDRFSPGSNSPVALPKVASRQISAGKKKKAKDDEVPATGAEKSGS
jgi:small basic protein (TIGR04137 family)